MAVGGVRLRTSVKSSKLKVPATRRRPVEKSANYESPSDLMNSDGGAGEEECKTERRRRSTEATYSKTVTYQQGKERQMPGSVSGKRCGTDMKEVDSMRGKSMIRARASGERSHLLRAWTRMTTPLKNGSKNGSFKIGDRGKDDSKGLGVIGKPSLKRLRSKGIIVEEEVVPREEVPVEKSSRDNDKADQSAEQKHHRSPSRVLDKYGRKIRVNRKALEESFEENSGPRKTLRRKMKIDPYDISNKRLDDSLSTATENVVELKTEMSKNAQFRAIQPSPAILSFVEDNLLGRRRLIELQNTGYNVKLSAPLDNIPFSTSIERERIEENVFRNKLEFFAAAKISSSFPPPVIPEIAFAGRSNVGKSSLLNALTRQWGVVRTSDKPGLTQTINFFGLSSKLCLVDLPGYGFAYAKEEVKDAWEELVKEYISSRVGLQRVCLLIDTKWGMKPRDHELVDLMERSQTPYQIVLTKTDIVFPIDVARRAMQIQENLKSNKSLVNPVMMVSSKSGAGILNLRSVLAKLARFVKP